MKASRSIRVFVWFTATVFSFLVSACIGTEACAKKAKTGSIKVTITPGDALGYGARWKVDSGKWQRSGATVSNLSPGLHSVTFKKIVGKEAVDEAPRRHWYKPVDKDVTIAPGQTSTIVGEYRYLRPGEVGG